MAQKILRSMGSLLGMYWRSPNFEFHHLFLVKVLQVAIYVSLFSTLVNFFIDLPYLLSVLGFIATLGFSVMLYFVVKGLYVNVIKTLYVIMAFLFLNLLWFNNSGVDGTVLLMSVLFLITLIFLTKELEQRMIIASYFLNITALFASQFLFPDWTQPYTSTMQHHIDHVFVTYVVLFSTIPLVLFVQRSYVQGKLKAEESERIKTSFLANMSHEIRTPMNSILGFSELLRDQGLNDSDKQYYLEIIQDNGKVLLQLLNNIMEISKLDAQIVKPNLRAVNLSRLMEQVYLAYKSDLDANAGVDFRMVVPKFDAHDTYIVDELMVYQIMSNLVGNAIKYTQVGFVEMGYNVDSQRNVIVFYVRDSGIGIEPGKKAYIFNRFSQADENYTRRYGGVGLGLAITHELVKLLKGTITVNSEVGIGSCFTVELPLSKMKAEEMMSKHVWN